MTSLTSVYTTTTTMTSAAAVHYVSDDLYHLGSLACGVCGHQFPLDTSAQGQSLCRNCGTQHMPTPPRYTRCQHHNYQQNQTQTESERVNNSHQQRNKTTAWPLTGNSRIGGSVNLQEPQFAAARCFTEMEVAEAVARVEAVCNGDHGDEEDENGNYNDLHQKEEEMGMKNDSQRKKGVVRVGQTAVDNRVLEEAFCEHCATHRMCKTFARQTRSADEGQTIFFQCTVCNAEWQQSS